MILFSILSDRNHTKDSLNMPANVLGRHDRNFNRFYMIDKAFPQVILSSFS
jgi:hypothetical protein